MKNLVLFYLNRIRERLWVRPLIMCVLSVTAAIIAEAVDTTLTSDVLPRIEVETLETLLEVMAASMLVIATFAVASMVAAYASASSTATPRSFPLIVSDDLSQNALSSFIGAFIFSIVALIALKNGYYDGGGQFILFVLTLLVFAWVVLTFLRWVDGIARLGRLGSTIDKVETATAAALDRRRRSPTLGGVRLDADDVLGRPVYASVVGYVQRIDVEALHAYGEESGSRINVAALPGTFAAPGRALAYVAPEQKESHETDGSRIRSAFLIGDDRIYEEDPRFGLVVLGEIASRALSPAVNDPGTAIDIIGTLVRLFARWAEPAEEATCPFSRIHVPEISVRDMFDDAFTSISRDGASSVEVAVRLQKAFAALASMENPAIKDAARHHSELALKRTELALQVSEDLERVRAAAVSDSVPNGAREAAAKRSQA